MWINDIQTSLNRIAKHRQYAEGYLKQIHAYAAEKSPQLNCEVPDFDQSAYTLKISGIDVLVRREIRGKHVANNKPAEINSAIAAYAIVEKESSEKWILLVSKNIEIFSSGMHLDDNFAANFIMEIFDELFKNEELFFR